ncbi:MAG: hypothetical protein ACRELC_01950, partial [Gemmatimonadota bacterium]
MSEERSPRVEDEASGPPPERDSAGEERIDGPPASSAGAAGGDEGVLQEIVLGPERPLAPDELPREELPSLADRLAERIEIRLPVRHNARLAEIIERVNADDELYALWLAQNVNAVTRLAMSDHGPVHMQIAANSALRLLRLLVSAGVTPSIVRDYGMENLDAEVVVALAALFHDVGMSIHREGHEEFSLFVAQPILRRLLAGPYEPGPATIVRSEIQHAIISHRS